MSEINDWFKARIPHEWFEGDPKVTIDREEIVVTGRLPRDESVQEAEQVDGFREETRKARMQIADRAERSFDRKVAWGVDCGETREVFTNLSLPVMTRLRQPERMVLDTLVAGGVARSRADALAWCVRLVGANEGEWLGRMDDALAAVREARDSGPGAQGR